MQMSFRRFDSQKEKVKRKTQIKNKGKYERKKNGREKRTLQENKK